MRNLTLRPRDRKSLGLEFVVGYSGFRRVGGLLFPFAEAGMAMGMPTANTKFDAVLVNPARK